MLHVDVGRELGLRGIDNNKLLCAEDLRLCGRVHAQRPAGAVRGAALPVLPARGRGRAAAGGIARLGESHSLYAYSYSRNSPWGL